MLLSAITFTENLDLFRLSSVTGISAVAIVVPGLGSSFGLVFWPLLPLFKHSSAAGNNRAVFFISAAKIMELWLAWSVILAQKCYCISKTRRIKVFLGELILLLMRNKISLTWAIPGIAM